MQFRAVAVTLLAAGVWGSAAAGAVKARTQALEATRTSSIAGVAIDSGSRHPLARVRVELWTGPGRGLARQTTTDASGRFQFPQLPPGAYELSGTLAGYTPAKYGQKKPGKPGAPIQLADRQQIKDLALALTRGAAISGTVIDAGGQQATGFAVYAMRRRFSEKGPTLEPAESSPVDDRGNYRVFGLDPGEYFVLAQPPRDPSATRESSATADQPQPADGLAPSFHPGTLSSSQAAIVTVGPAEERNGIDIVLPSVPLVRVSGTMTAPNGAVLNAGSVTLIRDDEIRVPGVDPPRAYVTNGRFTVRGIVPGSYFVQAISSTSPPGGTTQPGNMLFGFTRATLSGPGTVDLAVTVQPGVSVSGRVTFPGGKLPAPPFQVALMLMDPNRTGQNAFGLADLQGRFTIPDVAPGPYRFSNAGAFDGSRDAQGNVTSMESLMYQGRNFVDLPFEVGSEDMSDVAITFTKNSTELSGTARDAAAAPLTEGTVIVFQTDKGMWLPGARGLKTRTPDASGNFKIAGLPAGEYFVVAVTDVEQDQWYDTRYLERISGGATRVRLGQGAKVNIELRAVPER